jgi:hypothetical protein
MVDRQSWTKTFVRIVFSMLWAYYDKLVYLNSNQGMQFTPRRFQELFVGRHTQINMDGNGRWVDNVFMERF